MDMRTVHSVNSLVSCVLALFLNAVLLWLVLKRAPKEMQVYSRILIQTILVDIVLAVAFQIAQPIIFTYDQWTFHFNNGALVALIESTFLRFFLFMAWLFLYLFSIAGLAVQFVYRYFVLVKGAHISMPRYLAMLGVPAVVDGAICFMYYRCAMPTAETTFVQGSEASQLLGDPVHVSVAAYSLQALTIANTGFLILTQIVCYVVVSVCGYLVVKFVRENTKLNPAHKEMNKQLTLNLILQAILPFLLCTVNIGICSTAIAVPTSISNTFSMQLFEMFSTVPMHWLPMLNPVVTMVVVKQFRRTLLCVKTTNANANNVVVAAVPVPLLPTAQMAVARNEAGGRPRVVTFPKINLRQRDAQMDVNET